jgi:hypothetical protein
MASVAVYRRPNEVLSEGTSAAPLMASAANAVAGARTRPRHRPVRQVPKIRARRALDYLAVQGYVGCG